MPRDPWFGWTPGSNPLHRVCLEAPQRNRRSESIAWLLRDGCSAKKKDSKGFTPLHHLCFSARHFSEFKDCSAQLLEAHADVNAKDRTGRTPLMDLCANESVLPEMITHLLQHGADVTLCTRKQVTALHELCSNGHLPPACTLLQARAEVNAMCSKGTTPLHCLCDTLGSIHCRDGVTNIHELLEAGADASLVDQEGRTSSEVLISSFFKRDWMLLHGFHGPLCPDSLNAAVRPLLMAEAVRHKESSFEILGAPKCSCSSVNTCRFAFTRARD